MQALSPELITQNFKKCCGLQLVMCALALIAITVIALTWTIPWLILLVPSFLLFTWFNMRCPACRAYLYSNKQMKQMSSLNTCVSCNAQLRQPKAPDAHISGN